LPLKHSSFINNVFTGISKDGELRHHPEMFAAPLLSLLAGKAASIKPLTGLVLPAESSDRQLR